MNRQELKHYKIQGTWYDMRHRCNDSSNKRYGGRGIKVCERWNDNTKVRKYTKGRLTSVGFLNFLEDMGTTWFPGATIDRIDSDGDYTPENCQWLTRSENTKKVIQTDEVNQIRSKKLLGRLFSEDHKKKIGAKMKGNTSGCYNKGTVVVFDTVNQCRTRVPKAEYLSEKGIRFLSTASRKYKEMNNEHS